VPKPVRHASTNCLASLPRQGFCTCTVLKEEEEEQEEEEEEEDILCSLPNL
jgi:hypothetical protein